jgi:hypothetical protein
MEDPDDPTSALQLHGRGARAGSSNGSGASGHAGSSRRRAPLPSRRPMTLAARSGRSEEVSRAWSPWPATPHFFGEEHAEGRGQRLLGALGDRRRGWDFPWRHRRIAATSPACWSETTGRTPASPRSLSLVRKVRQKTSSSESPTETRGPFGGRPRTRRWRSRPPRRPRGGRLARAGRSGPRTGGIRPWSSRGSGTPRPPRRGVTDRRHLRAADAKPEAATSSSTALVETVWTGRPVTTATVPGGCAG